jgi:cytochrome c-type biogenesis protein CcmE
MIAARKKKLLTLLFALVILGIVSALVLYALRQNISLFYTPTQVVKGEAPQQQSIRIGGMVEKGSILRSQEGLNVQFNITDYAHTVTILYTGILPDLFRDEQGVVVQGKLGPDNQFVAQQVLAKHDANYMPPEAKAALVKKIKS